jgi:hypothetical protein
MWERTGWDYYFAPDDSEDSDGARQRDPEHNHGGALWLEVREGEDTQKKFAKDPMDSKPRPSALEASRFISKPYTHSWLACEQ